MSLGLALPHAMLASIGAVCPLRADLITSTRPRSVPGQMLALEHAQDPHVVHCSSITQVPCLWVVWQGENTSFNSGTPPEMRCGQAGGDRFARYLGCFGPFKKRHLAGA